MTPEQEERYHALHAELDAVTKSFHAAMARNDIAEACRCSQEQLRIHRALNALRWGGPPQPAGRGHDWRGDGVWWRTCARCGLRVSTLVAGGEKFRGVEYVAVSPETIRGGLAVAPGTVIHDPDTPIIPCTDGVVGVYRTWREVAPWEHT